jgi:hypothetical protein
VVRAGRSGLRFISRSRGAVFVSTAGMAGLRPFAECALASLSPSALRDDAARGELERRAWLPPPPPAVAMLVRDAPLRNGELRQRGAHRLGRARDGARGGFRRAPSGSRGPAITCSCSFWRPPGAAPRARARGHASDASICATAPSTSSSARRAFSAASRSPPRARSTSRSNSSRRGSTGAARGSRGWRTSLPRRPARATRSTHRRRDARPRARPSRRNRARARRRRGIRPA